MNLEARWGPAVLSEGLGLRHLSVMKSTRRLRRATLGERFCRWLLMEYPDLIICLIPNFPPVYEDGGVAPSEPHPLSSPLGPKGKQTGVPPAPWVVAKPIVTAPKPRQIPLASSTRSSSPEMLRFSCELVFFITGFLWLIIRRDRGCR